MRTIKLDRFVRFQLNEFHPDYECLKNKLRHYMIPNGYYQMTFYSFMNEICPHMKGGLSVAKGNEIIIHD